MATSINTHFEQICLSANLPDPVSIQTSVKSVIISIWVAGDKVFESTYYPFNNMVQLHDVRSIVEAHMFDQGLDFALVDIEVDDGSDKIVRAQGIGTIASSVKIAGTTDSFLTQQFLTTRKSALIPRNGQVYLTNFAFAGEYGRDNGAMIYYSDTSETDKVRKIYMYLDKVQSSKDGMVSVKLDYNYFRDFVKQQQGIYDCIIRGADYLIGKRMFRIYFTDETPTDVFFFFNAFGETEMCYLFGATTIKTEMSRSEAVCGRDTIFYDETMKVKHEVETAPLTFNEARWMTEMLTSKYVAKVFSESHHERILISDITSEVTDSDKELTKLKFSWKYANGSEWA